LARAITATTIWPQKGYNWLKGGMEGQKAGGGNSKRWVWLDAVGILALMCI